MVLMRQEQECTGESFNPEHDPKILKHDLRILCSEHSRRMKKKSPTKKSGNFNPNLKTSQRGTYLTETAGSTFANLKVSPDGSQNKDFILSDWECSFQEVVHYALF